MEHLASHQFTRQRRIALAVLLVLGLLTASACGGGGTSPETQSKEPDPQATFTYSDITAVDSMDSAKPNSSNAYRWLYPVYDRLLTLNPDGTLEPGLAAEWSLADGSTSVKLTLESDATFQDGSPIDSDAVKANLERAASLETATSIVKTPATNIKSIETPDEQTVVLALAAPDSGILFEFAQGLGMMQSPKTFDADPDTAPIGSGPYKVSAFEAGEEVTLSRVDDYWGDASKDRAKTVKIISQPNATTRFNALRNNEINQTVIDPSQIKSAKSADIAVDVVNTIGFMNLYGNVSKPALKDLRVREAIDLALNRGPLVSGLTYETAAVTNQLFGSNTPYFLERPEPKRDVEKAKAMLNEAGYSEGKLELSILILNRPLDKQLGEAVQQALGDAGITVKLKVVDPARFDEYMEGKTDMWIGRWNGRVDGAETINGLVGKDGFLNASHSAPEELTSLLAKASKVEPGDERDGYISDAAEIVVDQKLTWPIFDDSTIYASSGCELNLKHSITSIDDYGDIQVAKGCGGAY